MHLTLHCTANGEEHLANLQAMGLPVHADAKPGHRLLLDPRALPEPSWAEALGELLASHPQAILLGRAWALDAPPRRLDPPDQPGWLVVPPLPELASTLPADPAEALALLLPLAARHHLSVREASDVAPLQRRGAAARGAGWAIHPGDACRLGRALPEAPALELLLLAPAPQLAALTAALSPAERLPWQVISEPLAVPASVPAALRQALRRSRADLLWPLTPRNALALPPPALLAAALRHLRRADLDGLNLGPHGLVLRRSWWLEAPPEGPPHQWAQAMLERGAKLGTLPLQAPVAASTIEPTPNHVPEPTPDAAADPLWSALISQLDRADALLLAQQQRIHGLEQRQRQLMAQLNRGAESPAPPPSDPTAD